MFAQTLKKMPKYCQPSPNMVRVEPLFPTTQGSHFQEISPTITFCGFVPSYIFVPPSRRKCIPLRCGSPMVLPIPQDGFGPLDFSSDILREFDFRTEFDFGQEFSFNRQREYRQGRTGRQHCTHSEVTQKGAGKDTCTFAKCNAATKSRRYEKKRKRCHPTRPIPNCSFVDWIGLTKSQPHLCFSKT